jgi:hypothetical protein
MTKLVNEKGEVSMILVSVQSYRAVYKVMLAQRSVSEKAERPVMLVILA